MAKKQNQKFGKEKNIVQTISKNNNEQKYSLRGRKFEGYVIKKFEGRVVIEFERVKLIRKYERYAKSRTKMHARLPFELKDKIQVGDYVQIMECRPLSKIIHHIVINKIRDVKDDKAGIKLIQSKNYPISKGGKNKKSK